MKCAWTLCVLLLAGSGGACAAGKGVVFGDIACESPPPEHCQGDCDGAIIGREGNAVEPVTGRRFFLDYPCDLRKGEPVVFILSLHGAGSIGNWQRHYFPALDLKEKYRLVIATPTAASPPGNSDGTPGLRMWRAAADDAYLQAITDHVLRLIGQRNVRAFWLAGHSQGGLTANRIVCSAYFRDKVDGWLSLSGGRLGRAEVVPDFFGPAGPPAALSEPGPNMPLPGIATLPDCDISFIFTSGEHEIVALPATSPWADRYRCGPRVRRGDVVDTRKGYVTGARAGRGASWGREARPGTAQVYEYPRCRQDRVIADVLRIDKGHTEGLEPQVTETLVRLMTAAPGGKVRTRGR